MIIGNAIVIIAIGAVIVCVFAWMTMGLPPKDGFHNGEVHNTPNAPTDQEPTLAPGVKPAPFADGMEANYNPEQQQLQSQPQPQKQHVASGTTVMINNNTTNNRCGGCGCDDCCDDCCDDGCGGGCDDGCGCGSPATPFLMFAPA
jgi:hypothetical protein